ncbi:MAG: FecR domain-containing protein [Sphingomonas sp.]
MDEALNAYGRRNRPRNALFAGGIVAVLAVLGGFAAFPSVELFLTQPRDYAAAAGTIRKVRLDDGTQLILAGGADLHVRYTRFGREVALTRGTIFADVVHDESRPFHVEARNGEVTVLGTRFEVARKPSSVRVTVEAGHVRLRAAAVPAR